MFVTTKCLGTVWAAGRLQSALTKVSDIRFLAAPADIGFTNPGDGRLTAATPPARLLYATGTRRFWSRPPSLRCTTLLATRVMPFWPAGCAYDVDAGELRHLAAFRARLLDANSLEPLGVPKRGVDVPPLCANDAGALRHTLGEGVTHRRAAELPGRGVKIAVARMAP